MQLVSSATATPKTDAFNFLAEGAGGDVFEVFLKVLIITEWSLHMQANDMTQS